ncbi:phosphodiester glycosidase family protein [Nocardioides sp. Leaf374]|uniref:phosphodiester glycosidase family protein n=1 Tax=Nocardioides sp. Leaf374 TaxID=2876560 RepID=UPI00226C2458|nr:phosphodiester glycosidase family protein [Nocardioides sp. Leaf374]
MRVSRPLAAAALSGLLALGAPALATPDDPAPAGSASPDPSPAGSSAPATRPGTAAGEGRDRQTSDGFAGTLAAPVSPGERRLLTRSVVSVRQVAPGVELREWSQTDARGPVRAHLLVVDPSVRGVGLDYANPGRVAATETVLDMAQDRPAAVGAVNGDFYDIGRTGAPLGVGRSQAGGVMNARASGWNSAFYLGAHGAPHIGTVRLRASVVDRPGIDVTNLNSHVVAPGGVGIYTPRWGRSPGYQVVQGQQEDVRLVVVRDGRVVANRTRLQPGARIDGRLLVGRGDGARSLRALRVGTPVRTTWSLEGAPRMVVTGNKFLVDDGVVQVVDDREMHPRTAVGIDADTGEVLVLVVDGRSQQSRGHTMVELADLMIDLGADEALNLDGGGSSTLVAEQGDGGLAVENEPSDDVQRSVANSLLVTYVAPRG